MGHVAAQIFKRSIERNSKCTCCSGCNQSAKPKQIYEVLRREHDWAVFRYTFVSNHVTKSLAASGICTREAAERIAVIYEEVVP